MPVWHSSITQSERADIARVQKSALHVISGMEYITYEAALKKLNLETLESSLLISLSSMRNTKISFLTKLLNLKFQEPMNQ